MVAPNSRSLTAIMNIRWPRSWRRPPPRLPLDHATALQHRRQVVSLGLGLARPRQTSPSTPLFVNQFVAAIAHIFRLKHTLPPAYASIVMRNTTAVFIGSLLSQSSSPTRCQVHVRDGICSDWLRRQILACPAAQRR